MRRLQRRASSTKPTRGLQQKGVRVALALAFKNANELRRAARLRTESDENMFKRWESLVCPLRCVVVVMKESAVSRIFRGAKRGIEALSELDASRVDLVNRKRDVNWRVIDKHLRKVMREMPPSLQGLSEYANDQQFLQAARSALGDAESADALFNAAIVALLFDARLQRELGTESPAWSWISRHARIQNASEHVPAGGTAAYRLVVDFCIELGLHEGDIDGPPRMMDQDLALVYERERRQPLPRCMRPEKYFCDGCFAKDIQPRDMARVAVACPLCSYSLCAACGEGVADHVCDGRCVPARVPFPFASSVAATAYGWRPEPSTRRPSRNTPSPRRWHGAPQHTQVHFGVKVELITFMQRFMTSCVNCPDLIRTDARLAANVALHARLADQRRWIRTVDRDRMVRQKRREGRPAAEFLAAACARNPFASGSESGRSN